MSHPKVAVVILNYNGKHFLEKFLSDVIKYSAPYEVVVADNASTDDSVDFMKKNFPEVKLLVSTVNHGYAGGYNVALKQLNADYFVLLNNDVEVTKDWLLPMVDMMEQHKKVAVCQPKLLDQRNRTKFEYAGGAGGYIDKYVYPFCRGRIFNVLEEDNGQYNSPEELFWASGACMMVRSDILWQAGGLDEDYFAHMEEIDLCWRIKNLGHKIMFVPNSTVYHVGGGTLNKVSPRKTYLNFRNNLITLVKNHPSKGLFAKVIFRLILDGVAGAKFLVELQPAHCWAVIKAHFSFYGMLGSTLQKRKELSKVHGYKPTLHKAYNGNIVMEHFVTGVKIFSDLKKGFIN